MKEGETIGGTLGFRARGEGAVLNILSGTQKGRGGRSSRGGISKVRTHSPRGGEKRNRSEEKTGG